MTSNGDLFYSWLQMAHNDILVALSLYKSKQWAATIFHLQQAVEKLEKALLTLNGVEPRKTHTPSRDLLRIISSFDIPIQNILFQIVTLARTIEDEGTRPRYGIRHVNGIKTPQEIYNEENAKEFLADTLQILKLVEQLLTTAYSDNLIKNALATVHEDQKQINAVLSNNNES